MLFDEFVDHRGPELRRLAYVLTSDSHRAEDLVQTVLLDVYLAWDKISRARNMDAYVRRMLVNAHIDWHRRRSSAEQPTDPATLTELRQDVPGHDHQEARESDAAFRTLVDQLSPRARTILVLRYYADLSDREIAKALGLRTSSVRATAARALKTLRTRSDTSIASVSFTTQERP